MINSIGSRFEYCDRHSRDTAKFHKFVQVTLKFLAKSYGLRGVTEYGIPNRGDGRGGAIDVVWLNDLNKPVVAIEIDNANNKSAISKLTIIPAELKIWVYYGNPYWMRTPPSNIVVISKRRVYS
jgi:hypothetical protein